MKLEKVSTHVVANTTIQKTTRSCVIGEYDKDVLKTRKKTNINAMQAFALSKVVNEKIYKLREFLKEFDPIHVHLFMVVGM